MDRELALAIEVAREAGALLLERFGAHLSFEQKARRNDLVTEADRASEALIVSRIRAASPAATIVGEEGGIRTGSSDERWFVDPLDGTTNFAHTHPLFCVSIACERADELIAAVVYAPKLGELYAAEHGAGGRVIGRDGAAAPLRVSPVERVAEALLCTGFAPGGFDQNLPYFASLSKVAHAVRRDGTAALDLAFTAAGRYDGFWEWALGPWDVAAGTLLVREAGGVVSAIDGSRLDLFSGSILASNGRIHAESSERMAQVRVA
ncbi:MAG: inositol monophosphatase [Candidatus Eremiobacteraeota bacterium]|nr:inositol monophosphatase [Candidatus Eremiobacteraeota bacterium]